MLKKGIVILTYNDIEWTENMLNTIVPYDIFDEIVVVDNCSTRTDIKKLQIYQTEHCHIIRSERNGGYSYGNNYGAKYLLETAPLELLFFSNPDVIFKKEVILEIEKKFENSNYSVLSGVMKDINGQIDHTTYWNFPKYKEELLNCFILYRKMHKHSMNEVIDFSKPIMDVHVLTGAFFAIKVIDFKKIDMFDENVFLFSEENILGMKIERIGGKEGLITDIFYTHYESKIIKQNMNFINRYRQQMKSKLYYFKKYGDISRRKLNIMRVLMDYSIIEMKIFLKIKDVIKRAI